MRSFILTVICALATFVNLDAQRIEPLASIFPANTLVIPVVANAAGTNGTHFRTDVVISNHLDVEQEVPLYFFAEGQPFMYGDPAAYASVILGPRSSTTFVDVVGTLLETSGLGSLVINPDIDTGFDSDARLTATYRIWTASSDGRGEVSQSSAGVDIAELRDGQATRVITGVKLDADFRCNVGIFNYSYSMPRTFLITARSSFGSVTTTATVDGYSMAQVPIPPASLGYVTVTIDPLDTESSDLWTAYATSVDNRSGDSWLQNAAPLDPASSIVIPVAAEVRGAMGKVFRTDLSIVNHLDRPQPVAVSFFAQGRQDQTIHDPAAAMDVVLEPNSTTTFTDVVSGHLRDNAFGTLGVNGVGTIVIRAYNAGSSPLDPRPARGLSATYRIWTEGPGGVGEVSQSSSGLDLDDLGGGLDPRIITGVRLEGRFRCNVGIFNYSSSGPRTFLITARSGEGSVTTTATVPGTSMAQIPLPYALLGYVTVTVVPLDTEDSDVWAAYATTVDNQTGDSWLQNATPSSPGEEPSGQWSGFITGGDRNDEQFTCNGLPITGSVTESGSVITGILSGGCGRTLEFELSLDQGVLTGPISLTYPDEKFVGQAKGTTAPDVIYLNASVRTPSWIIDGLEITLRRR